jgi:REP element-mobilizing transposase RayT
MKRTFERRPPRLGRIFATGPLYFVTFCTHERQRFLAKDEVHTAFVLFAKRAEDNFNVAVGRYVIMPDHVHLFVRGGCNFRLGAWIGALKQVLAKAATLSRAKGQIWEEGFLTTSCERMRATRKRGITFARIPYAPDWWNQPRTGLTKERSFISIARDLL